MDKALGSLTTLFFQIHTSTESTIQPMLDFTTRSKIHRFATGMLYCLLWPFAIPIRGCQPCAITPIGEPFLQLPHCNIVALRCIA